MMKRKTHCASASSRLLGFIAMFLLTGTVHGQMGHVLDAVGTVNQSMGGAGTALPLDAVGSIHWNPASIVGLRQSEFGFSAMAFAPETSLSSSIQPNTFGPGAPPIALSGTTSSDTDISPIPSFGFVKRDPYSPWTFGLGGYAIAGFGVDFPADPTNPILTPQPADGGFGFGPIYSEFQLMQFAPTVALQLDDGWSVGVAPTINWASLAVSPFSAASPDAAGRYNSGASADAVWGLGFQVGVFHAPEDSPWSFGLSYKSPQWFQTFKINSVDSFGAPRVMELDMDYPAIVSGGLAYHGFDRARLAFDVRYIDYEGTDGFQRAGFDPTGAVTGFGWESIWAAAVGIEFDVTSQLKWRFGYAFNESPINSDTMFFNTPSTALIQNHLSTGFTREFGDGWVLSGAFKYGVRNSEAGRWHAPGFGQVPGTRVKAELATYALSFGVTKRF